MDFIENAVRTLWRTWLIAGVIAIAFGLVAVLWTQGTVDAVTMIGAAAVLLVSVLMGALSIWSRRALPAWWLGLGITIIGAVIGVSAMANPSAFSALLAVILGVIIIVSGVGNLGAGAASSLVGVGWPIILSGVIQIIVGIMLIISPFTSLLAMTWVIGVLCIILGITMLVTGLMFRSALKNKGEAVSIFATNVIDTQ